MDLSIKKLRVKQRTTLLVYSLVVAHFFIALGRDDAFGELFWQAAYYQDLFFVSLSVFVSCLFILFVWKKLDQVFSWQEDFKRRLISQLLGGILLRPLISASMVSAYLLLISYRDIVSTSFFYYELTIAMIINLVVNLLLRIQHLISVKGNIPSTTPSVDNTPVVVQSGKSQIMLDPA